MPFYRSYGSRHMETLEFLSTSLHIITIFATPLHILGIYCILCKTPKTMNSVKWVMFHFHFWCILVDWSLTIFIMPFMLFPAIAGFPLGLFRWFGIPTAVQEYLVITFISALGASIVQIFENRFFILFARDTRWKDHRHIFIAANFTVALTYFLPSQFLYPDQSVGLQHVFQMLPPLPSYILEADLYVFAIDLTWTVIPVNIMTAIIMIEFYTFITLISRNMKKAMSSGVHSKNTLQMQKKFLKALNIQCAVLLINLQVPLLYFIIAIFGKVYNQAANNLCFIFLSLHGISGTIVMLLVHKPYWEFCSDFFGFCKDRKVREAPITSIAGSIVDDRRKIITF